MSSTTANKFLDELQSRSEGKCELCLGSVKLSPLLVPNSPFDNAEGCILSCESCNSQLETSSQPEYWKCLEKTLWTQVPAVQVTIWRQLSRLKAHTWADDLLGQLYLDPSTLDWAVNYSPTQENESLVDEQQTVDSNGNQLLDGDTVQIIKDLDVKGTGFVAKRGTMVKGIRLTGDPKLVEGRVKKTQIVLKTCFLKKS